jgi:nicotinamidase-related amidase
MKALLVVDMQVGCFAGDPPRKDEAGTVRRINALARAIRPHGPVVFIQHAEPADGFTPGSDAWQLLSSLERAPQDLTSEKTACDAFLETGLDALLKERSVTETIVVGCATDFCVDTTVRSAAAHGYKVTVAGDAHTTRDRPHLCAEKIVEHHNFMWGDLLLPRQQRVRIVDTATLLSELGRNSA